MLNKWSEQELLRHMQSGRIICSETSTGVWEYKDTKDIARVQELKKEKTQSALQDKEITDENSADDDLDIFSMAFDQEVGHQSFANLGDGLWTMSGKGQGKYLKGQQLLQIEGDQPWWAALKGKGKGQGKGSSSSKGQLAVMDTERETRSQTGRGQQLDDLEQAYGRCRQAGNLEQDQAGP